jgi:hypothetical protein
MKKQQLLHQLDDPCSLHTWVRANYPCAMENEEFIPGLICIVEMEVETALKRQQAEQFQNLQTPSMQ